MIGGAERENPVPIPRHGERLSRRGLVESYRTRCRAVLHCLTASITDDRVRRQFVRSAPVSAALL
jgi:hypothetical protein